MPKPSGWTLRFGDDFAGAAHTPPTRANWRYDLGHQYPGGPPNWGTGEMQTYTADPANIGQDGQGNLRITPLRDAAGHWTSSRIETRRDNFKPPRRGVLRIEARIQMPNVTDKAALGYWPAFWALGRDYRRHRPWPQVGEFDMMENVNGINSVWGILHCGIYPGGPCGEPNGLGRRAACVLSTCQAAFHVYTFEWDESVSPGQLRWYVDGQIFDHVSESQLPPETWKQITGHGGFFLLLNVAMGGGFSFAMAGGQPTPTPDTEPGHSMLVDYVAVWTKAAGVKPDDLPAAASAAGKPADTKPAAPAAAKPVDGKPAVPTAVKPADARPAAPAAVKPADARPAVPAAVKPADAKPADAKPAVPAAAKPAAAAPAGEKPAAPATAKSAAANS